MSPVQVVQFPAVKNLYKAVQELKQQKINVYPILSPTVKEGENVCGLPCISLIRLQK